MSKEQLLTSLRELLSVPFPLPGQGQTGLRHRRLMEVARKDLSLARLVEAHVDAVAILAEAEMQADPNAIYGVWASEKPGQPLRLDENQNGLVINGAKSFCSGAGLIDRALVTATAPEQRLIDVNLRSNQHALLFDYSAWKSAAFLDTQTATVTFNSLLITEGDLVGPAGWYLDRPGFWHGACGPAACWAGGAVGLLDYALQQKRSDPHTLAHLGAMHASVWALGVYLESAGREIDDAPADGAKARLRARTVRHLVEQASTDMLRRLLRAYGPHPLVADEQISHHYAALDLYLRQWHSERDLEALGNDVLNSR